MTAAQVSGNGFGLPWDSVRAGTPQLRRWLIVCGATSLLLGALIPWLPLPELQRHDAAAPPAPLTQIVLERPQPVIPPPPPIPRSEPPPPPPETRTQAPTPAPTAPTAPPPAAVDPRERAASAGLLAFSDALADMRNTVDTERLQDTGAIRQGSGPAATVDRSVLTAQQSERSSGVNASDLSRATGGVALAARETTRVESTPASGGTADNPTARSQALDPRQRSIEDVRRVFDANKGAIFAIYNRALRLDPSLRGQVILELVIEPAGHVSAITVVSSELADDELVARLIGRIRMFDFGAREVSATRITYPVHFLPS